jgi:hypothetical protein
MDSSNWVSSVADVVLALGVFFVFYQVLLLRQQLDLTWKSLKADHERSRKEMAVSIIREWNRDIKPETSAADKLVTKWNEEQCRNLANLLPVKINPDQVHLVNACTKHEISNPTPQDDGRILLTLEEVACIRYAAADYLNSIECVLLAWQLNIVDRETIERQFQYMDRPKDGYSTLECLRVAFGGAETFPATEEFIETLKESKKTSVAKTHSPLG